ncbi:MAG: hypothetical protein D8M58_04365 [Calditrichaeota bacterium]|nr:MAG: hypothetical protein DWQ03_02710 [Calditrichota bacterium]MBL1204604.1 hypothetical protein [Calditrichota bacterium]NOG44433.1 hypothetical protein [Calditrichota bacterium]
MQKIVLFGSTGLGNSVLSSLAKIHDVNLELVITNKYKGKYPYYREIELFRYCHKRKINYITDVDVNEKIIVNKLKAIKPDLIIVSSFNQILRENFLSSFPVIINFHPSLLPKYRGASPFHGAILNGEKETGITVHHINSGIDTGNIIIQKSFKIDKYEMINTLIKRSHKVASQLAFEVISKKLYKTPGIKHKEKGTYYNRPINMNQIKTGDDFCITINKIRAFGYFPGILLENKLIKVRKISVLGTEILLTDIKRKKYIIKTES